jgi:hypothetical protein
MGFVFLEGEMEMGRRMKRGGGAQEIRMTGWTANVMISFRQIDQVRLKRTAF